MLAGSGWQIAPDTYYATVKRPLPARAVPDPGILAEIRPTRTEYEEVYGAARRAGAEPPRDSSLSPGPQERLPKMQGLGAGPDNRRGQLRRTPGNRAVAGGATPQLPAGPRQCQSGCRPGGC